jgi:enoyl-CoA hydratase/carnithine racemase
MYTEVLFEEMQGKGGDLGIITLNRPKALNSLNHDMAEAIYKHLLVWEAASHIKAVVIRAVEGRAFCAGGDLRLTYERMKTEDPAMADFFRDEYQLNRKIFHYSKPYIALLDGITMGGGVGISIHGSHRVATDNLLFAMPETGIGFFPDVGGSYFLPRLASHIGYYLGLTGARISADDCVQTGIATHKVAQHALPALIHELAEQPFMGEARSAVSTIIEQFQIPVVSTTLINQADRINQYFSADNMEDILHALQKSHDAFCKDAVEMIAKKSPTSLKVSLLAMQKGSRMNFDDCMQQELILVTHFLKSHDFAEGIRAVIIDKDQRPVWKPASLSAVSEDEVKAYFEG